MKVTVRVYGDIEMHFATAEAAALELLKRCDERFLGKLKLDGLAAIQREKRGVRVRKSEPPQAEVA